MIKILKGHPTEEELTALVVALAHHLSVPTPAEKTELFTRWQVANQLKRNIPSWLAPSPQSIWLHSERMSESWRD